MTEKRFEVIKSEISGLYVPIDNNKEFVFEGVEKASTLLKLTGLLNEQHKEIQFLRQLLNIGKTNAKDLIDVLNDQEQEKARLKDKLNKIAFEFLKHGMISMGKVVEISEMSYHEFLKYRKEKGYLMELQL